MAKILGITEDGTGCGHCGRANLKRYVAVELEDGSHDLYGTTCGPKVYGREVWAELNAVAVAELVDNTPGAAHLLGYLKLCRPARITSKFRAELDERAALAGLGAGADAAVAAAVAAYRGEL